MLSGEQNAAPPLAKASLHDWQGEVNAGDGGEKEELFFPDSPRPAQFYGILIGLKETTGG